MCASRSEPEVPLYRPIHQKRRCIVKYFAARLIGFYSFSFEFSYSHAPFEASVSRGLDAPSPPRQKPLAERVFIVQNGCARPSSDASRHSTNTGRDEPVKSGCGKL